MLWLLQTFKGQILRKIFFAPCIAKTLFYSLVKKKYLKSLNDTEISRKTVLDWELMKIIAKDALWIFRGELHLRNWITMICIICLHCKSAAVSHRLKKALVNFGVRLFRKVIMSSLKREKTTWIKSGVKPGPKKEKKDEESFDESNKEELTSSNKSSWFQWKNACIRLLFPLTRRKWLQNSTKLLWYFRYFIL